MSAMRLLKVAAAAVLAGLLISVGGAAAYAEGGSSEQAVTSVTEPSGEETSSVQSKPEQDTSSQTSSQASSQEPVPPSSDQPASSAVSSDAPTSDEPASSAVSSDAPIQSSSNAPPEVSSATPPERPNFRVETSGRNITNYFKIDTKNVQIIRGQVPASVEKIIVTITAHGVTNTETLILDNKTVTPGKNGFQHEFSMTFMGLDKKTAYTYYILVVREYDLSGLISVPEYSSRAPSSALSSAETSSAVSSARPSSASEAMGNLSSDEISSAGSSVPDRFSGKNQSWLLPVAILLIILGAGGIGFVVWEILKMRGVLPKSGDSADGAVPEDEAADGFVDILGAAAAPTKPTAQSSPDASAPDASDPDDGKIDLDKFFNSKS